MSLSPSQIIAASTETAVVDTVLSYLRDVGFRTTSWQDGSVQKELVRGLCKPVTAVLSTFAEVLDRLLVNPGGPNAGAWQDLRGTYWLQLPRLEAVRTVRGVVYTSAASAPSHVITVGSQFTADGVAFELLEGATLLPGTSSAVLSARALAGGTAGNVGTDAVCALVTPYAGVTAALDGDPTTEGTERETNARYQRRQDLRLSELTYSIGIRAYELWALTADASIDRVRAWANSPDPNVIKIAIEPGTLAQLANVAAYVSQRQAVNDQPESVAANPNPQTISLRPRIQVGTSSVADIEAAITAYLDSMPLGGVMVAGASNGRLLPEAITRAVLCGLSGVESVGLLLPAAPVVMGATDYIVPTFDIVPEWVSQPTGGA